MPRLRDDTIEARIYARFRGDRVVKIKNALKYRRKVLRNLKRLDHLLILLQLRQNGKIDERAWAQVIRRQHEPYEGHPPPRRTVDDATLRPR